MSGNVSRRTFVAAAAGTAALAASSSAVALADDLAGGNVEKVGVRLGSEGGGLAAA